MEYSKYVSKSVDYASYQELFVIKSENPDDYHYGEYIPMNQHRSSRLDRTFKLSEEQIKLAQECSPRTWLVISEHWCGDASQIVPVMAKIAQASQGKINFQLVYRDEVPKLMQAHLTNGGMSVPKLIQLDENSELINDWGPRPKAAQEMVIKLKSDPETAANYIEELHKWYAKDKQQSTVSELMELIS
ncbi:MAG: hypothetical protein RL263_238 [Bacteroidota bacterium]